MSSGVPADRTLAQIVGRCAVLAGIVVLAAVPVYIWVEPWWRALVARLASAFVLGIALIQLRRALAEHIEDGGPSALDAARRRRELEPGVPHHFLGLEGDVRAALRSRRSFEKVLWPRLVALTPQPLVRPPARPGLGPSLAGIRAVIDVIEKQP
jgi:hypothetical protein